MTLDEAFVYAKQYGGALHNDLVEREGADGWLYWERTGDWTLTDRFGRLIVSGRHDWAGHA
jgi:hypothetical protein